MPALAMNRKDRYPIALIDFLEAGADRKSGGRERLGVGAKVDIADVVAIDQLVDRLFLASLKADHLLCARPRFAHILGLPIIVQHCRRAGPAAGKRQEPPAAVGATAGS